MEQSAESARSTSISVASSDTDSSESLRITASEASYHPQSIIVISTIPSTALQEEHASESSLSATAVTDNNLGIARPQNDTLTTESSAVTIDTFYSSQPASTDKRRFSTRSRVLLRSCEDTSTMEDTAIMSNNMLKTWEPADSKTHDGWSGPKMGAAEVTTRTKGRRTVFLYKAVDVALFDRIAKWKTAQSTLEDAWELFGNSSYQLLHGLNHSPDAIIKLHLGISRFDYVLKYKISSDPRSEVKQEALRRKFELKLLQKGLIVEREVSFERPHEVYVKIVAPFSVLCVEAQVMKLKLPLKLDEAYTRRISILPYRQRTRFPRWIAMYFDYAHKVLGLDEVDTKCQSATFKRKDLARFRGGDTQQTSICGVQTEFFRDSHRSLMTYNIISHIELSIQISGIVGKHKDRRGIDYLLSEGVYTSMFHLHDNEYDASSMRERLRRDWVQQYFKIQPIDDIASYFGETVGLYFAFIGFYNLWLLIATALGIIVVIYGLGQSYHSGKFNWFAMFDNDLTPFFGLFMSLWAILMPLAWNRQTKFYAWKWSTSDYQKEETKRPQYKGETMRRSPITGKMEIFFPYKKRFRRQTISAFVLFLWILLVCSSIAGQVSVGAFLSPRVNNDIAINVITSLLGLASIVIMKIPFGSVVERLNEWENYRTKSQFDNALIFKTYIFDFANSYSQLIYYAFVKPNLLHPNLFGMSELNEECTKFQCASSVTINLFVIFIGGQIIERFQELAIPLIVAKFKQIMSAFRIKSRRSEIMRQKTVTPSERISVATSAMSTGSLNGGTVRSTVSIPPAPSLPLESPQQSHVRKSSRVVFSTPPSIRVHVSEHEQVEGNLDQQKRETTTALPAFEERKLSSTTPMLSMLRQTSTVSLSQYSNQHLNPYSRSQVGIEVELDEYLTDDMQVLPPYYRDDKLNEFGGIRDEYSQKIVQFGYIALFACSFPLAPLFALVNNTYELRADAYKLLVVYQRPQPFLAQDIGVWAAVIKAISLLSVATNSVLVSFTSPTFDALFVRTLSEGEQLAVRLAFIIVFHYSVLALTQVFSLLVPQTPALVATAMARAVYLERVHMDKDLEEEDESFNQDSLLSLKAH
ncbi:calcium-activated chloride channel-domain-containing protein [Chytriomyces cf. hyalinus JEL632]|nr:calcium-activated chloride channel-domain-containing protein [Chytriomyces cf. hyalinus JEL632]